MSGELEATLAQLDGHRREWTAVGASERASLLQACVATTLREAPEWVRLVCRAKGIATSSQQVGEAWFSGPMTTIRTLRVTAESLLHDAAPSPRAIRRRGDQVIATVTPQSRLESLSMGGLVGEIWLQPGAEPTQGSLYHDSDHPARTGGLALVLGAGNVSAIAAKDIVYKLVADNEVVILKMHPVTSYLTAVFERAFAPLIDAGYLAICEGDAEVGEFLCGHELVTSIHLTGSDRTFDAIVWGGSSEEQHRRKAAADPLITKAVTAELGCVTPVLVVPGQWSDREVAYQAASVAGMVTHNASFNCTAAKAIVTAAGWPQREQFRDALRQALRDAPPRQAYYPGAQRRYEDFVGAYPAAEVLGARLEGVVPWTLLPDVAPTRTEYALSHEAFCGVVADVAVEGEDAEEFLAAAVRCANEEIWGSLSCNVLVDPRTEKKLGGGLENAIAELRYGGTAVNTWGSAIFGLATTTWGAFPGNALEQIGSGVGLVGNALFFDHPQKSVAYGAFMQWPKPPWWPVHRTLASLGRRWTDFEARPTWAKLPGFAVAAARG